MKKLYAPIYIKGIMVFITGKLNVSGSNPSHGASFGQRIQTVAPVSSDASLITKEKPSESVPLATSLPSSNLKTAHQVIKDIGALGTVPIPITSQNVPEMQTPEVPHVPPLAPQIPQAPQVTLTPLAPEKHSISPLALKKATKVKKVVRKRTSATK
jgi:hypothetical protein